MPSDGTPMMGGAPASFPSQGAPSPQAPPAAGPGAMPPPTGPTGATMPVENQGLMIKAMAKLAELAQGIQMVLAVLPVGSDASRDISDGLNKIKKHLKQGAETSGPAVTERQLGLMQQRQMGGAQMAAMRGGGQQQPPGAPPAPPAAA